MQGDQMDRVLEIAARAAFTRPTLEGPAGALSILLDELTHGVLLATAKGQVLHANLAARRELARRRMVYVDEGRLQTADAAQARVLALVLAKAESGRRSLIALRTDEARLSIAVVPLRSARGHDAPSVALIFSRPAVCDAVMLCFFARAHGLTPSEEQVLAILCQGYSAPEVAVQLDVAVSTVRSHVRSMCAKTQSNGVRALVGLIAVLPPIGASQLQDPLH
jgi:DNA-binding CsgD family transcriptional regulator